MEATARCRRVPGAVHRIVRGQVLLMRSGGEGTLLEGLAALVWVALDQPASPESVAEELQDLGLEGPCSPEQLADAFDALVQEGLLEPVAPLEVGRHGCEPR